MSYMKISISQERHSFSNLENLVASIAKKGFEVVSTLCGTSVPVQIGVIDQKAVYTLELGVELIVKGEWDARHGLVEFLNNFYQNPKKFRCIDVGGPVKKEDYHNVDA